MASEMGGNSTALFKSLLSLSTKKTCKPHTTGPLWVESMGDRWIPLQMASNEKAFLCDDVIIGYHKRRHGGDILSYPFRHFTLWEAVREIDWLHHAVRLNHWGRVAHICVSKLTIIGSDNGLSPGRRQAIIWTNAGILLIRILGTNFSEIPGKINSFSFKKMHLKMSSAKGRLFMSWYMD